MATITAAMVKDLRESTGAGMMDCKAALTETNGDMEAAQDWLRKKGLSKAAKKSGRVAAEGLIGALTRGNKGVVVEVNSETDFVARNDQFQGLAGPRGTADDLKKLPGVSGAIEKKFNDLGIFHFWQLAELDHDTAHKIGEEVGLPSRADAWVAKAKALTAEAE